MANYTAKPCDSCCKVACPEACDSKNCIAWQNWFEDRWAGIHGYYLRARRSGRI